VFVSKRAGSYLESRELKRKRTRKKKRSSGSKDRTRFATGKQESILREAKETKRISGIIEECCPRAGVILKVRTVKECHRERTHKSGQRALSGEYRPLNPGKIKKMVLQKLIGPEEQIEEGGDWSNTVRKEDKKSRKNR